MGKRDRKIEPYRILIVRPKISAKQRKNQFRHESPTGLHAVPHYYEYLTVFVEKLLAKSL